jgi:translation initiation factor IF-3
LKKYFSRHQKKSPALNVRKNEAIRAKEVRLIAKDGEQVGVVGIKEALNKARQEDLDLIEISAKANPPVCKIGDFGSFVFNRQKAERKQKVASKQASLKSLRFGIRISDHDLDIKINKARKFLSKNHPVKIILQFKGREGSHADLGLKKMRQFITELEDVSKPESEPKRQGNRILLTLKPEKKPKTD